MQPTGRSPQGAQRSLPDLMIERSPDVPATAETPSRVSAAAIQAFMTDAFCACGLPAADAAITAGAMLDADLSGADAHGIFRLPGYVRTIKRGHINAHPDIRIVERGPATAL